MGTINLAQNWERLYAVDRTAQPAIPSGYVPIPDIAIPLLLNNHFLAVTCESQEAKSNWWLGCRLAAYLDIPGSEVDTAVFYRKNIPVNRPPEAIVIPEFTDFRLVLSVPWWLKEVSIVIYHYIGPDLGLEVYVP